MKKGENTKGFEHKENCKKRDKSNLKIGLIVPDGKKEEIVKGKEKEVSYAYVANSSDGLHGVCVMS